MNAPRARVFVAPHALARFRERIRRALSDDEIIAIIQAGVAAPHSTKARQLADGTPSVTVKVKGQEVDGVRYSYRVVLLPPAMPGGWPVVGTVLPGTSGASRGRNHYSQLRARGVPAPPAQVVERG